MAASTLPLARTFPLDPTTQRWPDLTVDQQAFELTQDRRLVNWINLRLLWEETEMWPHLDLLGTANPSPIMGITGNEPEHPELLKLGISRKGLLTARKRLTDTDLREIGEFTRGNIERWLLKPTIPEDSESSPVRDFHAVCGDVDIPWATEAGKLIFKHLSERG